MIQHKKTQVIYKVTDKNTMKNKVLIVDDDLDFANALETFITKSGGYATVCTNATDALDKLEKENYTIALIDCLLPITPGVELAKKIRKSFSSKMLTIIMMSGVFNDRATMKEIINDTQAKDFLKKPFQPNYVLNYFDQDSTAEIENPVLNHTFTFYSNIVQNIENIQDYFSNLNEVSGYDLMFVISALVDSKHSGTLHLINKETSVKTNISFKNGSIAKVDTLDAQSFIGRLLLSRGYVLVEDLEGVLRIPSNKKLATRLLEENLISPHSFEEVIVEQISIRISKLIGESKYFMTLDFENNEKVEYSIESSKFDKYFMEWVKSRITDNWLQNEFVKWYDFEILKLKSNFKILNLPHSMGDSLTQILTDVDRINSFGNLLKFYENNEKIFFYNILFLLGRGALQFGKKIAVISDEERFVRLQKIYFRMLKMNKIEIFELMGGKKGFGPSEIKSVRIEFEKKYLIPTNPKKIPGFEDMINEVKRKVQEVMELYANPSDVIKYENEIESQKATEKIKYQELLVKTRQHLSLNQFTKALELLIEIPDQIDIENKKFYHIWATLGSIETKTTKLKEITELEELYETIPSEQKLGSLGNFIRGLLYKNKGDYNEARKYIETSLALDSNFIEGRRELKFLKSILDEKVGLRDAANISLRKVVNTLIKK